MGPALRMEDVEDRQLSGLFGRVAQRLGPGAVHLLKKAIRVDGLDEDAAVVKQIADLLRLRFHLKAE